MFVLIPEDHVPSYTEIVNDAGRDYCLQVLRIAGNNVSRAARIAGRNRTDFYKLLAKFHISPPKKLRADGRPKGGNVQWRSLATQDNHRH